MLLDDYLKRNLKDFFKSKRADFDELLKHAKEQIKSVRNPMFKAYYKALSRICEMKLNGRARLGKDKR